MRGMKMKVFLSYCHKDAIVADNIDLSFKGTDVSIKRDVRDIPNWKSIKEFMNTIREMEYAIMIISENYLKSEACMYEVMEVMKNAEYAQRIFPVVVDGRVYDIAWQMDIVKFWQDRKNTYEEKMKSLEPAFSGQFSNDVRHCQNIASYAADFMKQVADMNNPDVSDAAEAVKLFLSEKGEAVSVKSINSVSVEKAAEQDIFAELGIAAGKNVMQEFTDIDKNNFAKEGYRQVIGKIKALSEQLQKTNPSYQMEVEEVTTRDTIVDIYHNGKLCRKLNVFLDSLGMGSALMIGLSDGNSYGGGHHSYNGSYMVENSENELYFKVLFSMMNQGDLLTAEGVTKHIWENYIAPYLR
jgi:hypothetical protein